jgi:hypothetical protein
LSSQYRRKMVLAGIMAAMLLISFFITLQFIGNGAAPLATEELSDVGRLARRDIYDRGDLIQAAVTAGAPFTWLARTSRQPPESS